MENQEDDFTKKPKLLEAWPIPIAINYFHREFTDQEREVCMEFLEERVVNMGNSHSFDADVLEHPVFADIKKFCLESVSAFMYHALGMEEGLEPYITISWINACEPGQSHHRHAHPNSLVSGVFYFNANEEQDNITFYKPGYHRVMYWQPSSTKYNIESFCVPVHTGHLVLFDSSIEHAVDPTQGEHVRISLSFNTFIKGTVGKKELLTRLPLS